MPTVKIDSLTPFEGNAKRGDIPKIRKSLEKLGQYKPIVVNLGTKTGRTYEILAGNNTWEAAKELGWEEIEIHEVDVDPEEAAQINLLDNKLNELGTYDEKALAAQLADLTDFEITGYSQDELDHLLRNTASMADAFVEQMNSGLQDRQPSQVPQFSDVSRETSGAEGDVSRETSDEEGDVSRETSDSTGPAEDGTVYVTISYTVTGEQREQITGAIRKIQGEIGPQPSPVALAAICERFLTS
jgi:hypothetical protein